MKKSLFILIVILSLSYKAYPNPIAVYSPITAINEIYFDDQGKWIMELRIWFPEFTFYSDTAIEQIEVCTLNYSAYVRHFTITDTVTLFIITEDSLTSPLYIDPESDDLYITTYGDGWTDDGTYMGVAPTSVWLSYGGPGGVFSPTQGSSISLIDDAMYYYLDTSPTMGYWNDTIGGLGQMHGRLYDCDGNVFTSGNFKIKDNLAPYMQFNEDSTYTAVAPASYSYFHEICFYPSDGSAYLKEELSNGQCINVEPGQTTEYDIHLKYPYLHVGLPESSNQLPGRIVLAPNPFQTSIQFYFILDRVLNKGRLTLFSIDGKEKCVKPLPVSREYEISIDGRLLGNTGIYYYQVSEGGKVLNTGKIIYQP